MKLNKKISTILAILIFLGIGASFMFKKADTTVNTRQLSMQLTDEWQNASDTEKIGKIKERSKKQFGTVEEAAKELKYNIKKPSNTYNRKLLGVFVAKAPQGEEGNEEILALYENGLYCVEVPVDTQPDYPALLQQMNEDKNSGSLKSDKVPTLVNINGFTGMGVEAGYNESDNQQYLRPGFVQWYQNGVYYNVFGGKDLTLSDLIKVAESMGNVN